MKKFLIGLLTAIMACTIALGLFACGGNNGNGNGNGDNRTTAQKQYDEFKQMTDVIMESFGITAKKDETKTQSYEEQSSDSFVKTLAEVTDGNNSVDKSESAKSIYDKVRSDGFNEELEDFTGAVKVMFKQLFLTSLVYSDSALKTGKVTELYGTPVCVDVPDSQSKGYMIFEKNGTALSAKILGDEQTETFVNLVIDFKSENDFSFYYITWMGGANDNFTYMYGDCFNNFVSLSHYVYEDRGVDDSNVTAYDGIAAYTTTTRSVLDECDRIVLNMEKPREKEAGIKSIKNMSGMVNVSAEICRETYNEKAKEMESMQTVNMGSMYRVEDGCFFDVSSSSDYNKATLVIPKGATSIYYSFVSPASVREIKIHKNVTSIKIRKVELDEYYAIKELEQKRLEELETAQNECNRKLAELRSGAYDGGTKLSDEELNKESDRINREFQQKCDLINQDIDAKMEGKRKYFRQYEETNPKEAKSLLNVPLEIFIDNTIFGMNYNRNADVKTFPKITFEDGNTLFYRDKGNNLWAHFDDGDALLQINDLRNLDKFEVSDNMEFKMSELIIETSEGRYDKKWSDLIADYPVYNVTSDYNRKILSTFVPKNVTIIVDDKENNAYVPFDGNPVFDSVTFKCVDNIWGENSGREEPWRGRRVNVSATGTVKKLIVDMGEEIESLGIDGGVIENLEFTKNTKIYESVGIQSTIKFSVVTLPDTLATFIVYSGLSNDLTVISEKALPKCNYNYEWDDETGSTINGYSISAPEEGRGKLIFKYSGNFAPSMTEDDGHGNKVPSPIAMFLSDPNRVKTIEIEFDVTIVEFTYKHTYNDQTQTAYITLGKDVEYFSVLDGIYFGTNRRAEAYGSNGNKLSNPYKVKATDDKQVFTVRVFDKNGNVTDDNLTLVFTRNAKYNVTYHFSLPEEYEEAKTSYPDYDFWSRNISEDVYCDFDGTRESLDAIRKTLTEKDSRVHLKTVSYPVEEGDSFFIYTQFYGGLIYGITERDRLLKFWDIDGLYLDEKCTKPVSSLQEGNDGVTFNIDEYVRKYKDYLPFDVEYRDYYYVAKEDSENGINNSFSVPYYLAGGLIETGGNFTGLVNLPMFNFIVKENVDIYMKWKPVDYEFSFDVSGENGSPAPVTFNWNSENISSSIPTVSDANFSGWAGLFANDRKSVDSDGCDFCIKKEGSGLKLMADYESVTLLSNFDFSTKDGIRKFLMGISASRNDFYYDWASGRDEINYRDKNSYNEKVCFLLKPEYEYTVTVNFDPVYFENESGKTYTFSSICGCYIDAPKLKDGYYKSYVIAGVDGSDMNAYYDEKHNVKDKYILNVYKYENGYVYIDRDFTVTISYEQN